MYSRNKALTMTRYQVLAQLEPAFVTSAITTVAEFFIDVSSVAEPGVDSLIAAAMRNWCPSGLGEEPAAAHISIRVWVTNIADRVVGQSTPNSDEDSRIRHLIIIGWLGRRR